jgi:hypothetical protein
MSYFRHGDREVYQHFSVFSGSNSKGDRTNGVQPSIVRLNSEGERMAWWMPAVLAMAVSLIGVLSAFRDN